MAIPQNTYVYMEDVEKAEVEDEVSDEAWDTEVLCTYGGNQHSKQSFIKRNTGTQRLL